ncbi:MAG: hypothetical protein FK730_00120 [Asgard group archaeon]|nr:hypothetical protein [Asgard group archaeon]
MTNKSQIKSEENSTQLIQLSKLKDKESLLEIYRLINSHDFIDFVKTISETLDDGMTYNEFLSSQIILRKAKRILRKLEKEENQK